MAVDASGQVVTDNGSTWSQPTQIEIYIGLISVSGASPAFCVAVDASGNALTYDGRAWGPQLHRRRPAPHRGVAPDDDVLCRGRQRRIGSDGNADVGLHF